MQVDFKNGSINFEAYGSGEVLVLLHGFTESLKIWYDFKDKLAKKFHVILIDLPGHGMSSIINEVHSMELMADSVKAVIDHLRISSAVMVGHSMGGYVSLAFARKYSSLLKGMGLFHSTSLADSDENKEARERAIAIIRNKEKEPLQLSGITTVVFY